MEQGKRGVLIAALLLVLVLGLGRAGYDLLARRISAAGSDPAATAEAEPEDAVDEAAEAATDADAVADDAGADAAQQDEYPLLADHDPTVYTESGDPASFTQLANGRPLVINFWATWCPYCVEELPDFQQIVADYGDQVSFAFVDAIDGQRETVDVAAAYLADNGFSDLPAYYDNDFAAQIEYGIRSLPTTVVVDGSGQIVAISAGRIDPALLRDLLDQLV